MSVFDRITFCERHARIEHRARSSGKHRDVAEPRIEAITESPFDCFPIVDIDIVVNHDHVLRRVITEMAPPECCRDLLRVPTMALVDLNPEQLGPFAAPHARDVRYAGLLEIKPGHGRERGRRPRGAFIGSPGART